MSALTHLRVDGWAEPTHHTEQAWDGMVDLKVLVCELWCVIYAERPCSVPSYKVASLDHEGRYTYDQLSTALSV
jgi:hypothetical protein